MVPSGLQSCPTTGYGGQVHKAVIKCHWMGCKSLLNTMEFKKSQSINKLNESSELPPRASQDSQDSDWVNHHISRQSWLLTTQSHPAVPRPRGHKDCPAQGLTLGVCGGMGQGDDRK